ncbi:armadillo repeat-containing protein 8-like isoform X3 [Olea europaea var. sylvestris]|uniref:armadillo repeat-containing protein 8-like isoform X3 n=1 Tax=Olea europaea var. sylvestris TaxID=158386 RepID=UPI000C1D6817|nr:armadillo repeat-containing protein 8-like isoform X3 [Olea europaea var. sylvestris]
MPSSASSSRQNHAEQLIARLNSVETPPESKLQDLRNMKNQIIGSRTKKLDYLSLGAVPCIVSILSIVVASMHSGGGGDELLELIAIQAAAIIGSFACRLESGVEAVLEAGACAFLMILITHQNEKVVDAVARSLKWIYQSKLAPKFYFLEEKNMEFLLSLLNSKNENVSCLGANIITRSCQTRMEQQALSGAGVITKLASLLDGSLSQREASLESLSVVMKKNPEIITKFLGYQNGGAVNFLTELIKDKHPRTRLLACACLIVIRNSCTTYLQDSRIKTGLVQTLLELLEDPDQVGDDAPFVLSSLIAEKEDLQMIAFECQVIEKLCNYLEAGPFQAKRLQGIFLALADMCSELECCRDRAFSLEALIYIKDALKHDSADVRTAACIFLRNLSRSVKNMSAGHFTNANITSPMVQLLCDSCPSVQIAALGAICNMVIDFTARESIFMQGGLKQLVQLSKSMVSAIRVNAIWALRNLAFLVNNRCKEEILLELTIPTLTSLICDPETSVQEQALALVRNLVDGPSDSVKYVFDEAGLLLDAIGKKLHSTVKIEVLIQGMYVLSNIASGNEIQKEAAMNQLFPQCWNNTQTSFIKFLQSTDSRLRIAAVWALVNLTFPNSPGACRRVIKLLNAGIISQLKTMVNDPCLDVKLRARVVLAQSMVFSDA